MNYKCHIYNISGVPNMRDIGGYPADGGRATAQGRFIRSTALVGIGSRELEELEKLGIDCVIDLRSTIERKNAPDAIENSEKIHYEHVPMLDYISSNFAQGDFSNFPKSMAEMYIGLLENDDDSFMTVFELFADERFERYIFHCTAGKDRTGVTAMLLLGLAGVDDEAIIEDYSYTQSLLPMAAIDPGAAFLPRYLFESVPETMRDVIGYIRKKYGGMAEYLEYIGVDGDMRGRILKKFVL